MTKIFLITFVLNYGGVLIETSRVEFPSFPSCWKIRDQLIDKTEGSYAFECREIQND